jgi:UDP-N-acetylglucosamine 2-epimerase (non-hydrolysing)
MILVSFGTRPEYIKIKPILRALRGHINYKVLFTGQHPDLVSNVQEDVITLDIDDGDNRLDSIVASVMGQGHVFEGVDSVMVQGDTTSAFAIALAAFHRNIKVIHLEAGLRTYDLKHPYPEEFNRQAISRIADINLCPTEINYTNLLDEKVSGKSFIVGNTVLDNLVDVNVSYSNNVIVTMHRRENHYWIDQWFGAIDDIAANNPDLNFVLPLHPNPNVTKHRNILKNVEVIAPVPYEKFMKMLAECKFAITDSGGLQEEMAFFNKMCIVCRKETERKMGLGVFSHLCYKPENLYGLFWIINENYRSAEGVGCPYGDGESSKRIVQILKENHV